MLQIKDLYIIVKKDQDRSLKHSIVEQTWSFDETSFISWTENLNLTKICHRFIDRKESCKSLYRHWQWKPRCNWNTFRSWSRREILPQLRWRFSENRKWLLKPVNYCHQELHPRRGRILKSKSDNNECLCNIEINYYFANC